MVLIFVGGSSCVKTNREFQTLMLGGALPPKPRGSKRDATAMIRSRGFGLDSNVEPQPVDSAAVKLIKRDQNMAISRGIFLAFRMPLTRPWLVARRGHHL